MTGHTSSAISRGKDHVKTLVVDAAPLIKSTPIGHLAEKLVTIPEVLAEVRDKHARSALAHLPFEIQTRMPSEDAMAAVVAFSKKTGDYAALSRTDLKILALTYMLEKESNGISHLRTEPVGPSRLKTPRLTATSAPAAATQVKSAISSANSTQSTSLTDEQQPPELTPASPDDGRQLPEQGDAGAPSADSSDIASLAIENQGVINDGSACMADIGSKAAHSVESEGGDHLVEEFALVDADIEDTRLQFEAVSTAEDHAEVPTTDGRCGTVDVGEPVVGQQEEDDEGWNVAGKPSRRRTTPKLFVGGEDDGWITPDNINKVKAQQVYGKQKRQRKRKAQILEVACITSDFAMQNVLLQMGLKLLSVDGMAIDRVQSYVLRCHACFKVTKDMERKFCPSCGNNTLLRTTIGVDSEGNVTYYLKKNFEYNLRGTKYSIPQPKGGRRNDDMILREDQREYQRAVSYQRRAKASVDPFDMDINPLELVKDKKGVTGTIRIGHGRKNVNEAKKTRQKRR
ncbi:Nin1 binding protein [Gaertneriomyces sp. JEL0708]|nr:Nin1 binding protein [Gaertneriomyces sp. JEL0708]